MTKNLEGNATTILAPPGLRWGRIIAGAFVLELILVIVLVPTLQMLGPAKVIPFVGPAVFILSFGVACWLLRKVPHRQVVHGIWIGVIATAIYLLLCMANPEGIRSVVAMYGAAGFVIANGLRIVGTAAGGYVVRRRTID